MSKAPGAWSDSGISTACAEIAAELTPVIGSNTTTAALTRSASPNQVEHHFSAAIR
jgi:hypothetical protein